MALTVEQVALRIDQRFRPLTGGSRTALPRQQTLLAALDWSYDLLTRPERRLFQMLALLETVREYARQKVASRGLDEMSALRRRHAEFYTALAQRLDVWTTPRDQFGRARWWASWPS